MHSKNIQYKFNEYVLIPREGLLLKNGQVLTINHQAFKVLELMVKNPYRVIMKRQFMETVWDNRVVNEGSLTVSINTIRKILQTDRKGLIETYSRRGYRLNCKVEEIVIESENNCLVSPNFSFQTINNNRIVTNPSNYFPRLSKIVPNKILQIFLPKFHEEK